MMRVEHVALLVLAAALGLPSVARGQVGRVSFTTGDVVLQRADGSRVPATRGVPISVGDQIVSGDGGLAQLDMADRAKLTVRPASQVEIAQYGDRPDSATPATVRLLRGTMRSFTGALTPNDRERFTMKTTIATVGVRGSGNILFAGRAADCDPERLASEVTACAITVNHTIEGGHVVAFGDLSTAEQMESAVRLSAGPGQTVLVTDRGALRFIPLPSYLSESGANPTGTSRSTAAGQTRDFAPNDESGVSVALGIVRAPPLGDNGLGFKLTPSAPDFLGLDPDGLQDVVTAAGFTLAGQALPADIRREQGALRGYRLYPALGPMLDVAVDGGADLELQGYAEGGLTFVLGRREAGRVGLFGPGSGIGSPGSAHWILASSGYPSYLTDILTGTAVYVPVAHTNPTDQSNTVGALTNARLDVNFSSRTLDVRLGVSMPAAVSSGDGSWILAANGVPIVGGSFYASTAGRLLITNGSGARSDIDPRLSGNLEGRFVGSAMQGAAVGYTFTDLTSVANANHGAVSGVVGFRGPLQDPATPYRDGLVSDPLGRTDGALSRSFGFAARPGEVTLDAAGRVPAFVAPLDAAQARGPYSLGSASVAQSGSDASTGIVWGRWAGGTGSVGGVPMPLVLASLHYIFSPEQSGPVSLPLTGAASYEWVGGTSPTDGQGHVGTLTDARLAVDFGRRTVDLGLGLQVAGQSIRASAAGVPIYRGQYFSASQGTLAAGLNVPSLLNIACTPTCPSPTGSVDGFFAGRTGAGAGLMYHLNGIAGAAAFRRPGG